MSRRSLEVACSPLATTNTKGDAREGVGLGGPRERKPRERGTKRSYIRVKDSVFATYRGHEKSSMSSRAADTASTARRRLPVLLWIDGDSIQTRARRAVPSGPLCRGKTSVSHK